MTQERPLQQTPNASVIPGIVKLNQILLLLALWNSGYKGARVVNTLYALDLGASPWDTGLLLSTYGVCPLIFAVYAGRVADRYGSRMPIAGGLTVTALGVALPFFWPAFSTLFVGAVVSSAFFENAIALCAVCFVLGIGMGFGQPLSVILTYNCSPRGRAGEALGLRIALNNSMHVVAPSAFGAIGSLVGLPPVFRATALFLGIGARLTVRRRAD